MHPAAVACGVTPGLLRTAATPLQLPDDLADLPAIEQQLRAWVLRNLDHWVNGKGRSVYPVYCVLERTFVLDRLLHAKRLPVITPARNTHTETRSRGEELWSPGTGYWARVLRENGESSTPRSAAHQRGIGSAGVPPASPLNDAATLGIAADSGSGSFACSPEFNHNPKPAQGNGFAYHRDTETPSEEMDFSVSRCLGGEKQRSFEDLASTQFNTAGPATQPSQHVADIPQAGRMPALHEVCKTSPEANREPWPVNREPLPAIPRWDPNYDVAAGLPPEIRQQHADKGEGIGNYEDEAIADYFAKAEAYCGADWRRYTRPPRIVDGYDPQHREYCVAIPDYEQPLLQGLSDPVEDDEANCEAESGERNARERGRSLPAASSSPSVAQRSSAQQPDCQSAYGATLGSEADLAIAPLADSSEFNHNPSLAQSSGLANHRDTETPSAAHDFSVSRCLGGEKQQSCEDNSSIQFNTAGGDKLPQYASFEDSPEANREPWPANREPQFGGDKLRPYAASEGSPETRRAP